MKREIQSNFRHQRYRYREIKGILHIFEHVNKAQKFIRLVSFKTDIKNEFKK